MIFCISTVLLQQNARTAANRAGILRILFFNDGRRRYTKWTVTLLRVTFCAAFCQRSFVPEK